MRSMGAALVFATACRRRLVLFHTVRNALRTAETPPIMKSTVDNTSEKVENDEERPRTGEILGCLYPLDFRHGFFLVFRDEWG